VAEGVLTLPPPAPGYCIAISVAEYLHDPFAARVCVPGLSAADVIVVFNEVWPTLISETVMDPVATESCRFVSSVTSWIIVARVAPGELDMPAPPHNSICELQPLISSLVVVGRGLLGWPASKKKSIVA
jgi:hypothetical protein